MITEEGALWDHLFPSSPQPFDPHFPPPVRSTLLPPRTDGIRMTQVPFPKSAPISKTYLGIQRPHFSQKTREMGAPTGEAIGGCPRSRAGRPRHILGLRCWGTGDQYVASIVSKYAVSNAPGSCASKAADVIVPMLRSVRSTWPYVGNPVSGIVPGFFS
jgi:hypothetical protein